MKNRLWLWIVLFVLFVCLLATLATSWNVVVHHWAGILFGSLGFVASFSIVLLFFIKILREMKLNADQTEFLAQVSHELKTPLSTIELSASLLQRNDLMPDETKKLWISHNQELQRLKREVNTLLEAARAEFRPFSKPSLRAVSLETWIQEQWPFWKSGLGDDSSIQRVGETFKGFALANEQLLNLLTTNIVDNAKKYAMSSADLSVKTSIFKKSGHLRWKIEFIDLGWGLNQDEQKKVFKRFYRARTSAPYAIAGTGLGLFLAMRAAKAQSIDLKVSSEGPKKGCNFCIEGDLYEAAPRPRR